MFVGGFGVKVSSDIETLTSRKDIDVNVGLQRVALLTSSVQYDKVLSKDY